MNNSLEYIWGMLVQEEPIMCGNAETKKLRRILSEHDDKLRKKLDKKHIEELDSYLDCLSKLHAICEEQAFIMGVRFATDYLLRALYMD